MYWVYPFSKLLNNLHKTQDFDKYCTLSLAPYCYPQLFGDFFSDFQTFLFNWPVMTGSLFQGWTRWWRHAPWHLHSCGGKPNSSSGKHMGRLTAIFHPVGIYSGLKCLEMQVEIRFNTRISKCCPESIHKDSQMLWYIMCIWQYMTIYGMYFLISDVWNISDTNKVFINSKQKCWEPRSYWMRMRDV